MAKANNHEGNGKAKAEKSVDELRKILSEIPVETKEAQAYAEHGAGVDRKHFRNLWLEIMVPRKSPPKQNEDVTK